jgi:hypothetical protein
MKRTHALIAVLALMSMTAAAQVANAQEQEPGIFLERAGSPTLISPTQRREGRVSAMTPIVGDRAHSKQTRKMALGKC